jgi:photosystem II stability/assembly factor-like uncharacterized protein
MNTSELYQTYGPYILTSINFADSERGIAVGEDGIILTTYDGGTNWEVYRVNTNIDFYSVSCIPLPNGKIEGIIVGMMGCIIKIIK